MKKLIFFAVFLLSTLITTAQEKKKIFTSLGEVSEAQSIGTADFYEPMYFTGHKNLIAGEKVVSYPYAIFVQMDVVGGKFWVVQKSGTQFVIANGQLVRRWDCGNKIHDFFTPPQQTVLSQKIENPIPTVPSKKTSIPLRIKTKSKWIPPIENETPSWVSNNLEWLVGLAILVGGIILYLSQHHTSNQIGPGVTTDGAGPGVQTLSINIGFPFGK
ncbi:MAG: hypothetical protein NT161_03780 [Candidatus Nomurabacteria bacterium]|nr:hypothetical protein [Candidatus Nomurabacteria bacterium]